MPMYHAAKYEDMRDSACKDEIKSVDACLKKKIEKATHENVFTPKTNALNAI